MRYAVAIETGNDKQAYGVVVPDLPGVFSAGDTLDEALANAEESILFALEDFVERGEPIPEASELATLMAGKGGKGGAKKFPSSRWGWHVVNVDASKLSAKTVRVNITMPEPLLKMIDEFAGSHGESRSGFLARAAQSVMNR
jgi:predicted RNase H-like HicB family nuclease